VYQIFNNGILSYTGVININSFRFQPAVLQYIFCGNSIKTILLFIKIILFLKLSYFSTYLRCYGTVSIKDNKNIMDVNLKKMLIKYVRTYCL